MADPKMVLPPPAPQSELEGIQQSPAKVTPAFTPAPNPLTGRVGGGDPSVRKDGGSARHPMTKRYTKYRG